MKDEPVVRVGQVWLDNDWRTHGKRQGKVVAIANGLVTMKWNTGRQTTVALRRFRPSSTGYRLVSEERTR